MQNKVVRFTAKLHPIVAPWWEAHGWPVVPLELLSSFGIVVWDVCAGWLYKTDSGIGWIEWIVSNPKATSTDVYRATVILLDRLKAESKSRGDLAIFSALKSKGLIRLYQNQGFEPTDIGMTHMVLRW